MKLISNTSIFNKKIDFNEFRKVDALSLIVLYTAQTLLFLGILLILFNNLDLIEPGNYFGTFNWITVVVFFIGLLINFVFIPFLYFSSFSNFKKESDFWDKETFWILPLFFFGTFFLYMSRIEMVSLLVLASVIFVILVHIKFFLEAHLQCAACNDRVYSECGQYFLSMKYLSAYYMLLFLLALVYNPFLYLIDLFGLYV